MGENGDCLGGTRRGFCGGRAAVWTLLQVKNVSGPLDGGGGGWGVCEGGEGASEFAAHG